MHFGKRGCDIRSCLLLIRNFSFWVILYNTPPIAHGIPNWSLMYVLTRLDIAQLQWSDKNQCNMAISHLYFTPFKYILENNLIKVLLIELLISETLVLFYQFDIFKLIFFSALFPSWKWLQTSFSTQLLFSLPIFLLL